MDTIAYSLRDLAMHFSSNRSFPTRNFNFNVIFLYFLCSDENDLVDVVRPGEDFKRIMSYVKKRNKSW